jgi:hypothetical protein
MLARFRSHLTYANVVSTLCLFILLGGSAVAASGLLTGKDIKSRSIPGKKLKKNTVTGKEVKESTLGQVPSAENANHANVADSATNASNLAAPEAFHVVGAAEFQNGWVAFGAGGSTPGFYKDQLGIVHLRGELKSGTSSNTATGDMFTLPTGYRPAENQQFQGGDATGSGNIAVQSSGEVRALSGTGNTLLSVDGFTFRAGA